MTRLSVYLCWLQRNGELTNPIRLFPVNFHEADTARLYAVQRNCFTETLYFESSDETNYNVKNTQKKGREIRSLDVTGTLPSICELVRSDLLRNNTRISYNGVVSVEDKELSM